MRPMIGTFFGHDGLRKPEERARVGDVKDPITQFENQQRLGWSSCRTLHGQRRQKCGSTTCSSGNGFQARGGTKVLTATIAARGVSLSQGVQDGCESGLLHSRQLLSHTSTRRRQVGRRKMSEVGPVVAEDDSSRSVRWRKRAW